MSLIEVVRRHKIDFGTKLQVVWSMYEVRNHKKTSENLVARRKFDQKSWFWTPRRSPSQKYHRLKPATYEINLSFCSKAVFKNVTHPLVTWADFRTFFGFLTTYIDQMTCNMVSKSIIMCPTTSISAIFGLEISLGSKNMIFRPKTLSRGKIGPFGRL